MILIPAIDLLDGRVVRLAQGDRARTTVYSDNAGQVLDRFIAAGAKWIHIVDLDGAFAGAPKQLDLVADLVARAHAGGARVEIGGGMRDPATVDRALLSTAADRIVVGTLAVRDPDACAELCARRPDRIIVAADVRDGKVAIAGWLEQSQLDAVELAGAAERWGAAAVLFTDVGRDGLAEGPALAATCEVQRAVNIPVYASGGVSSVADLAACRAVGVRGVVFGRALYEGAFTLEEALTQC